MRKKLAAIILLGCLLLTGCSDKKNEEGSNPSATPEVSQDESQGTAEDVYLIEFQATTVEGEEWNSDKFANSKLTLVNAWATYCNPCLSEMPDLGEIAAEYDAADFQIVGVVCDVTSDADAEAIDTVKQLVEETKAAYPHLLLNESLYSAMIGASDSVPTTYFINRDGQLLGYVIGAQEKSAWTSIIDELLAEME